MVSVLVDESTTSAWQRWRLKFADLLQLWAFKGMLKNSMMVYTSVFFGTDHVLYAEFDVCI